MRALPLAFRPGRFLAALGLCLAIGPALAEPVYPSSSRFGFEPPSDMAPSKRFMGFERLEGGAMLSVVELPAQAYSEVERSFTDEALKNQGFNVQNREPIKVSDGAVDAVLFTGEQPDAESQGAPPGTGPIRKWILLVNAPDVTGILVAQTLPGAETEETMRGMLTNVRLRSAPSLDQQVDALPFRLTDLAGFRPVRVLAGNSVLLTRGGKDQLANLEQPILVLAQAVQRPPAPDQRDGFARAALYANQTLKDFMIERSQGYRQNGVDWHEIVARATDMPTGQQVVVTQTIRFAPDGYLRSLGVVRADQRDETLSLFREVIDNVQIK